ncbi:MAG: hypothetical protein U0989_18455 [Azonexus sp.]|nr:hypothetical protein [Azonexus sp.]
MKYHLRMLLIAFAVFLAACSSGPGDIEGRWQLDGFLPMTVTYRDGEEEAMGIISKVSYKHEGNDVLVTYLSGMAEGNTVRLTKIDKDTFRSEFGTLRRVR